MTNPSFHLFQLQKVDLRIDQINTRLSKIAELLANNPQLIESEKAFRKSQEEYSQKEKEFANLDDSVKKKKIKIEQSESSLYSGKNPNPKELKDLQTEIDSLKRSIASLEEDQLVLMSLMDNVSKDVQDKQKNYESCRIENEKSNMGLLAEKGNLEKEKEKLLAERTVDSTQIPAEAVANYEKLRATKNHIAVTAVEDQSCSTCGSEITAADIQRSRTSSVLTYCPSCGRILYAG